MAITTLTRTGLPSWGADTDEAETRAQANARNQFLEDSSVLFVRGTLAARPAFGTIGRIYEVVGDATASNNGRLFWDTGAAWQEVARVGDAGLVRATAGAASDVPLIAKGAASQTGNLTEWQDSAGAVKAGISPSGLPFAGPAGDLSAVLSLSSPGASSVLARIRGAASQTGNLTEWQNNTGGVLASVAANGGIASTVMRIKESTVAAAESTSSTTYVNLATVGGIENVPGAPGGSVLVVMLCHFEGSAAANGWMGVEASVMGGAVIVSAQDSLAATQYVPTSGVKVSMMHAYRLTVTAGTNYAFTPKYRVTAGTGTFSNRRVYIIPFF